MNAPQSRIPSGSRCSRQKHSFRGTEAGCVWRCRASRSSLDGAWRSRARRCLPKSGLACPHGDVDRSLLCPSSREGGESSQHSLYCGDLGIRERVQFLALLGIVRPTPHICRDSREARRHKRTEPFQVRQRPSVLTRIRRRPRSLGDPPEWRDSRYCAVSRHDDDTIPAPQCGATGVHQPATRLRSQRSLPVLSSRNGRVAHTSMPSLGR